MLKRVSLILVAMLLSVASSARPANADILYTGSTIVQDFDSLGTSTLTNYFSATVGMQSALPGTTGFDGTKLGGSGTSGPNFFADNGSLPTGGMYSLGATGSNERALGLLASATNIMGYGFRMVNNSTSTVTEFTVSFTQENWRSSTSVVNTMVASYSFDQTISAASYLTAATGFNFVTALDLVGPAPVTSNGALDGNNLSNQVFRTFTFTNLNWAPGEQFFLRWHDTNDAGSDANLAIDNMEISFVKAIPEPGTGMALALMAVTGLIGWRRRHV